MTTMIDDFEQQLSAVLRDVRIPLENITFALDQYILQRGRDLDPETQVLLAGVRNSVEQVARSTRSITEQPEHRHTNRTVATQDAMVEHAHAG